MIIDVHGHLGWWFFPIAQESADNLIEVMDRYGIDVAIVSSIQAIMGDIRGANDQIRRWIEPYAGRLYGYVVPNPNYQDLAVSELEHFAAHPQFVGAKIHPAWHGVPVDDPHYTPIFEKCEELSLPVLAHSYDPELQRLSPSAPERLLEVARRHKVPIIMAHMGGNSRRGIAACASGPSHLCLEISAGRENATQQYVWDNLRIRRAIDALGIERVMLGTDMPLLEPAICLGSVADAELTESEKHALCCENAKRIFHL